ncbi:MAG: hypothetical protein IJL92_05555 [Thermoguttaceae bacterium]|nr:hypothetical protein [Thermoguttaceae bacterium]
MKVFKRVLCLVVLVAAGIVGAGGVFGAERVVVIGDEVVVDGEFVDITRYCRNESYSGVYVVRYVEVPDDQTATLKLGVKGYKTHVVERVYLNGAQVFFGELNVDDPEKQEATVQVQLKKGRNVMVARVDHTEWDWIVGFTLLDEEGRELQDSPGRW